MVTFWFELGIYSSLVFGSRQFMERSMDGFALDYILCRGGIALVFVIASWPFARFDLASLRVMPFYSYLIDAFMGIGLLLCISRILKGICFINYIGKNSLVIFALQAPVIRGVIYLTNKLLHCNVEYLRMNIGYSIMVTIGVLILMWPVVEIYNRLLNIIKGRFFYKI